MTLMSWVLIVATLIAIGLGILLEQGDGEGVLCGIMISGVLCWMFCLLFSFNYWERNNDLYKYTNQDVKAISTYTGVDEKEVNNIIKQNGDIEITLKSVMPNATDKDVKIVEEYAKHASENNKEKENE